MNSKKSEVVTIMPEDLPDGVRYIARAIGMDAMIALVKEHGGENIYIPTMKTLVRPSRDRKIRAEFNGSNHLALARKYRVSTTHIRTILKDERKKR